MRSAGAPSEGSGAGGAGLLKVHCMLGSDFNIFWNVNRFSLSHAFLYSIIYGVCLSTCVSNISIDVVSFCKY